MDKIEIKILNPEAAVEAEKMMVCAARLTQRGHKIKSLNDFMALYNKNYTPETAYNMGTLPHPTIQKFGALNVVIIGASRRFLAQITRHQNEVKFMSASLQYSDYSGEADFVVPYDIIKKQDPTLTERFLSVCHVNMDEYQIFVEHGTDNDAAGYMMPQALRNVLIISATPYQWRHMISQRVCRRNTDETRYVMLKIWEQVNTICPTLFQYSGPFCTNGTCREGKMSCGRAMRKFAQPQDILLADFPLLWKGGTINAHSLEID